MTLANKLNNFKKFLTILKKIEENCVVLFFFYFNVTKKVPRGNIYKIKDSEECKTIKQYFTQYPWEYKKARPKRITLQ